VKLSSAFGLLLMNNVLFWEIADNVFKDVRASYECFKPAELVWMFKIVEN
jgi:hypothetical protein